MSIYSIGLLDDDETDIENIKIALKLNWPDKDQYPSIKCYEVNDIDATEKQIVDDIENERIDCLLIDSRIVAKSKRIEGDGIVAKLSERFIKFPFIVLTVVSSDVLQRNNVDPDKVYEKQKFTAVKSEDSSLYVRKIWNNISQYKKGLVNLEKERKTLTEEVQSLKDSDSQEEIMEKYSKLWSLDFKQSMYDGFTIENPSSITIRESLEKLSGVLSQIDEELKRMNNG